MLSDTKDVGKETEKREKVIRQGNGNKGGVLQSHNMADVIWTFYVEANCGESNDQDTAVHLLQGLGVHLMTDNTSEPVG